MAGEVKGWPAPDSVEIWSVKGKFIAHVHVRTTASAALSIEFSRSDLSGRIGIVAQLQQSGGHASVTVACWSRASA
jgi:hypothetical protein